MVVLVVDGEADVEVAGVEAGAVDVGSRLSDGTMVFGKDWSCGVRKWTLLRLGFEARRSVNVQGRTLCPKESLTIVLDICSFAVSTRMRIH